MPRGRGKKRGRTARGKQGAARNTTKNKKKCLSSDREGEKFLPDEIIIEILSWLQVKWVLRCKCVCKLWRSIIQDRKFIEKHMDRGKLEAKYGNSNIGEAFDCFWHLHGLVLEGTTDSSDKLRIRNPATKQVLQLPNPEARRRYTLISFVSSTANYKVIYIHYQGGTTDLGMKVLTVGSDHDWRTLHDFSVSYDVLLGDKISVRCCKGIVYLTKFCEAELEKTEIIALMLEDEGLKKINIPQGFQSAGSVRFTWFFWDEKLSIGFIIQEELHVWILENDKTQKWSEENIIPLTFMKDNVNIRDSLYPGSSTGVWLPFYDNHSKYHLTYDIESKKVVQYASTTTPPGMKYLYSMRPSLVSLSGMRPEEEISQTHI